MTDDTIVERCAKAAYESNRRINRVHVPWSDLRPADRSYWRAITRTILETAKVLVTNQPNG